VVCGNTSLLTGPSSAPAGAVSVAAGDNSSLFASTLPASRTYWFAAGTHTLGTGEFAQIDASNNDIFIGGPGAVISGQDKNNYAIAGSGTNVTIEYLTIEDFTAPQQEGVVNGNLASGWTVENSTIENNPDGAGVIVDSNGVLNDDCLTENGQYGFQTYSGSDSVPVTNLTITNNEISDNDTQNYDKDGAGTCGCTGGGKFWNDLGATVTGNYIHDNESVGLWMDTNNTGFNISDNYFSHNWDVGIQYEISYNVSITDNTFVDNAWIAGPNNPGTGAIEINNSGSSSSVAGPYNTQSVVSGNVLTDNWGGIDIYEDADRYPVRQHLERLLHAREPERLHRQLVHGQRHCLGHAEPEPRLLRQLPLEEPEHLGDRQHNQLHTVEHRVRLHGCQRVRLRRGLFRIWHLCALRRLRGAIERGQQPKRRL
jgi:parallel beta-helix repeat protein